jgi:hypothetical protein
MTSGHQAIQIDTHRWRVTLKSDWMRLLMMRHCRNEFERRVNDNHPVIIFRAENVLCLHRVIHSRET